MALSAGTITINGTTGAHTGAGMAFAMFDAWWTQVSGDTKWEDLDTRIAVKEGMADLLLAIASGAVSHIVECAAVTVTVTTSTAGLQRLPDPPTAGSATVAPDSNKTLSGTVA